MGKGTVVRELIAGDPRLWLSRSWTTRDRRPGEDPDAYHFVTREQFEERIASGGFLEWADFLGQLMGTPKPDDLPDDVDLVLEIDVQGAEQVLAEVPDALFVFMDAPSREEQAARLRGRGDSEEQVARRLANTEAERAKGEALGATVVINDRVDETVAALEEIIAEARSRRTVEGSGG